MRIPVSPWKRSLLIYTGEQHRMLPTCGAWRWIGSRTIVGALVPGTSFRSSWKRHEHSNLIASLESSTNKTSRKSMMSKEEARSIQRWSPYFAASPPGLVQALQGLASRYSPKELSTKDFVLMLSRTTFCSAASRSGPPSLSGTSA